MAHAPEMKSYTVRNWISSFVRDVNGRHVETIIYSGHETKESAEAAAARALARYDGVVSVNVTHSDEVYEYEYCGDDVYDNYRWHLDRNFAAKPGQEVTPEIYEHMFNLLPPLNLPRLPETQGFVAGFMVSEPHDYVNGKTVYAAFGRNGDRCFFLGYLPRK